MAKRIFDIFLAVFLVIFLSIPIIVIALWIKGMSKGPAIFWMDRIGRNNVIFKMVKFRTMRIDTPQVATHLMKNPEQCLIPSGEEPC